MYKIIIDSCGELTDSLKKDGHFAMWHSSLMLTDTESAMMRALTSMIS